MTDWPKLTRAQCADVAVPGGELPVHPALAPIFADLAARYHRLVEPLEWPGCWGWADRPIAGTKKPSKHWLGAAVDLNAPRHPQGVPTLRTFTRAQVSAIAQVLARYEGLIEWGGTWDDPDAMHFELADGVTFARVAALTAKLGAHPAPPPPAPPPAPGPARPDLTGRGPSLRGEQGAHGPRVGALQEFLRRYAPAYAAGLKADRVWGPATSAALRQFAHRSGIPEADGRNIGPRIAAALYRAGFDRTAAQARVLGHVQRSARR